MWKSVLALSAQLSEKEALGVVLTEGRRYPRMSAFLGRRATCWVLGTLRLLVVHRCVASSLSGPYRRRSLVRELVSGNTSKLNLK